MPEVERKEKNSENLVQVEDPLSFENMVLKKPCTKKRIRRIAEPHIEPRKVHGGVYYYYRRGSDEPVYLGTADSIMTAVVAAKGRKP